MCVHMTARVITRVWWSPHRTCAIVLLVAGTCHISSSLWFEEIGRDRGCHLWRHRHLISETWKHFFPPLNPRLPPQFHPHLTAFRLCFPNTSYTQSPSLCVNRIITIHFLQGQISCRPRVCLQRPIPIDNHVCSSVGFPALSITPHPPLHPRLGRTSMGSWIHSRHELRQYMAHRPCSRVLLNGFVIIKNSTAPLFSKTVLGLICRYTYYKPKNMAVV
jgi:hypothetical protein